MAKPLKIDPPAMQVRSRRAYFDFSHGQLHVRTAFPGTGGFDELVPLVCLHASQTSSRAFARFLPQLAQKRSVYAPDLPGSGESDPSPRGTIAEAAAALLDLARDLRLRQIDVLGIQNGAAVALQLAASQPQLVRRLVLLGAPVADPLPTVTQPALVLRTALEGGEGLARMRAAIPQGKFVDVANYGADLFETAPLPLAQDIGTFLAGA